MLINRSQTLDAIHSGFFGKTVLVVGDMMLDRYLWGDVSRISPEAPVPVIRLTQETENGGGAANVALNLAKLGVQTRMVGWVGADAEGKRLRDLLVKAGVDVRGIRSLEHRSTITKTRVIGGHQQMLRIDQEEIQALDATTLIACQEDVCRQLRHPSPPDAVVFSDYGKGLLSDSLCQTVIPLAQEVSIPLLVDPKGVDYRKYRGATILTPNRRELSEAIPLQTNDLDHLLAAGEQLRLRLAIPFLAVTLSELGIVLLEFGQEPHFIPAMARAVFDVSGAGDTVIATLAAGVAAGLAPHDALSLANLAAGVVVAKVGTTPITRTELVSAFAHEEALGQSNKICTPAAALERIHEWRARGERVVFTNGCFDLLHAGHVTYLEMAQQLGQHLVVGLNSDHSVQLLKGPSRPVIHEEDRARVLAALSAVDLVVLFDEETPLSLISTLKPDVLAKGADYRIDQVVGAEAVKSWGGRVALVSLVEGRSSSQIMERIVTVHSPRRGE